MKTILTILPYKLDAGAQAQQISFIYQTYVDKLVALRLLPLLVPASVTEEMLLAMYEQADGVLLMGGADLDPALYHQSVHEKTKVTNPLRDTAEQKIALWALRDKKPLLGICRGLQVVNVVSGGTLVQHLPDITNEEHFITEANPSYDHVASDRGQFMVVHEGTRLAEIVGVGRQEVRCAHHQGVGEVGEGLVVNAVSEQGIVEGLESSDPNHFLILLQSHPETQINAFSSKIWTAFAQAVGAKLV